MYSLCYCLSDHQTLLAPTLDNGANYFCIPIYIPIDSTNKKNIKSSTVVSWSKKDEEGHGGVIRSAHLKHQYTMQNYFYKKQL